MEERAYISCRELIDFIAEYIDGGLPSGPREEFERHLRVCPSCVAYLDSYRATIELGRMALAPSDDPVGSEVPDSLVRAIMAARQRG